MFKNFRIREDLRVQFRLETFNTLNHVQFAAPAVLQKAGVQVFVVATAIFKHPQGIAAGVKALRDVLEG